MAALHISLLLQIPLLFAPADAPPPAAPAPSVAAAPAAAAPAAAAPAAAAPAAAPAAVPAAAATVNGPSNATTVVVVNQDSAQTADTAPMPPPPAVSRPPADATWRPLRPNARKGTFLIGTSVVFGAATWGLAIGQIALAKGCPQKIQVGGQSATISKCLYDDDTMLAGAGAIRGLANVANWGIAGAAGGVRGNYDAIDHVWGNKRPRRHRAWIGAGVGLTVAGMLTGALSSAAYGQGCINQEQCYQQLATYILIGQAAQSMFTAGVGMFTYGIVYGHERRDNEKFVGRQVSVRPQFGPGQAGAALSARF